MILPVLAMAVQFGTDHAYFACSEHHADESCHDELRQLSLQCLVLSHTVAAVPAALSSRAQCDNSSPSPVWGPSRSAAALAGALRDVGRMHCTDYCLSGCSSLARLPIRDLARLNLYDSLVHSGHIAVSTSCSPPLVNSRCPINNGHGIAEQDLL